MADHFAERPRRNGTLTRKYAEGRPIPPRRPVDPPQRPQAAPAPVEPVAEPLTWGDLAQLVERADPDLADTPFTATVATDTGLVTGPVVLIVGPPTEPVTARTNGDVVLVEQQKSPAGPVEAKVVVVENAEDPRAALERGLREMQARRAQVRPKGPGPSRW